MNDKIFQEVFDLVYPVLPQDWEKTALFAEYTEGSFSIKFYCKKNGTYIDCFNMNTISRSDLTRLFWEIHKILSKERVSLDDKNRWTVFTMMVEADGKMRADFDYEDHSEDMISFEREWGEKYLQ